MPHTPDDFRDYHIEVTPHSMGPVEVADCLGDLLPEEIKRPIFTELLNAVVLEDS